MISSNLYFDKRHPRKDGRCPILIYVHNRGGFHIVTPFSCIEQNWANNEFSRAEANYKAKNASLHAMCAAVERELLRIEEQQKRMSNDKLKVILRRIVRGEKSKSKVFVDYLDEFASMKNNPGTKGVYRETRVKIERYDPTCTFDTMDRKWLSSFESWMIESGLKTNARAIHLRNIRAVFNYAIDEDETNCYPFRKFKIRKEETMKRSLTAEQLVLLRDYPCEEHQEWYRDIFMLMFYLIGINASDVFSISQKQLSGDRIEFHRAKTGKLYTIKVEPEAQRIIDRYRGKEYLLNILDTNHTPKIFLQHLNKNLKEIGPFEVVKRTGKKIRKPLFPYLSSYWARHTWATMAAELDIPKETIAAALGHEIGSPITSIYIRFDMKKVDEANRKVIDYLNSFRNT
jgi:site-specific recombinase XerD